MHNFRELNIWKKSKDLSKEIILVSKNFSDEYKYSLSSQIVRSAVSVPSNIAEGAGRSSTKDFQRYLDIAQGSACELENQLIIAYEIDLLSSDQHEFYIEKLNEIQKMIRGFRNSLD
ncbi:four helix bundle protein [Paracrocinitomix mangrovi]|uniref:four helix bundle protein n=1 Tax=Paracrocinitomix mangrovi TaxID=2862509 RepID=UPI001C8E2A5C|nr:four helix bundle protein [Paracrocinitomix mangrovi]UKN03141.1 four helix bundle protein [Paracrocinitomix mangrovi]